MIPRWKNLATQWAKSHISDINQILFKKKRVCPSSEDFVTSRTRTKCRPKKYAPRWRTLSRRGLRPNMVHKYMPLVRELCHVTDFDQMWSKNVPLVGGLCHVTDFDQIWPKKMCPLLEDIVTSRTSTECG
jgi:hypothetical protein